MERSTHRIRTHGRARISTDIESDSYPLFPLEFHRTVNSSKTAYQTPAPETSATSSIARIRAKKTHCRQSNFFTRSCSPLRNMSWRSGLYAGLYASIFVLLSNTGLLLTGLLAHHGDVSRGVRTVAQGDARFIFRTSTAYHVLIKKLSTILLTSSNYAMQILCAPTRHDVDRAHIRGAWLEIGIMGIRNLRHIGGKRLLLWSLLAFSSASLHLFYNSSVFEASAAQDFDVTLGSSNHTISSGGFTWKALDNEEWQRIYATSTVPGYGDLHLLIDQVSYGMRMYQNWTYTLVTPTNVSCDWPVVHYNSSIFDVRMNRSSEPSILSPTTIQPLRFFRPLTEPLGPDMSFPDPPWPDPYPIRAGGDIEALGALTACLKNGWLGPHTAFHVREAHAKVNSYANRVQIAIPFLSIVIIANFIKVIAIYSTLRMQSSGHLITAGDAIASFLEHPEPATLGMCTLTKSQLCSSSSEKEAKPWCAIREPMAVVLGGSRGWSGSIILGSFTLSAATLLIATSSTPNLHSWGTAARQIIPFTSTTFDTRGALTVAFFANMPQVCLSLLYFFINRICTSLCFALEWNSYATHRKGLRVTSPTRKQRGTHFLQLPLRWAVSLNVVSGLLHWLLSQSLFLVRNELRTRENELYPGSTCACGYSTLSLLVFTLVFCVLLIGMLYLLLKKMEIRIPPVCHCSFVISAACHAAEDEVDARLGEVMWGVTEEATEDEPGHCTFTSREVGRLQPGALYA